MPLQIITGPEEGQQIVQQTLAALALTHPRVQATFAKPLADNARIASTAPIPVYAVDVADVAQGCLINAAVLVEWHYLVLADDETLMSATIADDVLHAEDSDIPVTAQLSYGTLGQDVIKAINRAEELPETAGEDFSVRLLEIPALYLSALWLHGERDLFLVLPPFTFRLTAFELVTENQLVAALREEAENYLSYQDDDNA